MRSPPRRHCLRRGRNRDTGRALLVRDPSQPLRNSRSSLYPCPLLVPFREVACVASSSWYSLTRPDRTCQVAQAGGLAPRGKCGKIQEAEHQAGLPRAPAGPCLPPSDEGHRLTKGGGRAPAGDSAAPAPGPGVATSGCLARNEPCARVLPRRGRGRPHTGARGRVSPSSFILVSVNPQSSLRGCTENTQPDTWLWRAPGDRHSSPAVTAPAGCQAPGTQRRAAPVWGRGRGAPRGAGEPRVSAMESICDWHSTAPGPVSGTGAPDRRRLGSSM